MEYKNFLALDKSKQDRIKSVCYSEFGRYGYKKTSTEQLAKKAGIAKGMLFHYFGTKKGLFEFLLMDMMVFINRYFGTLEKDVRGRDYIDKIKEATKRKLEAYMENPPLFEFCTMLYTHPENMDITPKGKALFERVLNVRNGMLIDMIETTDETVFRPDMDEKRMKEYIKWIIDGFTKELIMKLGDKCLADIDIAPLWTEFDEILEDTKQLFFRT